ncbi:DUF4169 family protein [Paracoccus cavernae]|uniref:DUF4169 family protein n=1 Tax=Paracoccus cavernae TaxID=1571207 RepID=UPI0036275B44
MGVINLRQARKDRERAKNRAKGDENAAKFGRTKAERQLNGAQAAKAESRLDGHRIEAPRRRGWRRCLIPHRLPCPRWGRRSNGR